MYMVRKRFLYWYVPTVTKVYVRRGQGEAFCFAPTKRVKVVEVPVLYIVQRLLTEYTGRLGDRTIIQIEYLQGVR